MNTSEIIAIVSTIASLLALVIGGLINNAAAANKKSAEESNVRFERDIETINGHCAQAERRISVLEASRAGFDSHVIESTNSRDALKNENHRIADNMVTRKEFEAVLKSVMDQLAQLQTQLTELNRVLMQLVHGRTPNNDSGRRRIELWK